MAKKTSLDELLTAADNDKVIKGLSFEEGIKLLEELVGRIESGTLSLDKAIQSYEHGTKLVEKLRTLLAGAEEKLKILQKN